MFEASKMLVYGLVIEVISLCTAIFIFWGCKKESFEFENPKLLPRTAKALSLASSLVNFAILVLFFASATVSHAASDSVAMLGMLAAMYLSGVSATVGPAASLLGIAFSVVYVKKQDAGRKGIFYVIISCLSFVVSAVFLLLFLWALVPYCF